MYVVTKSDKLLLIPESSIIETRGNEEILYYQNRYITNEFLCTLETFLEFNHIYEEIFEEDYSIPKEILDIEAANIKLFEICKYLNNSNANIEEAKYCIWKVKKGTYVVYYGNYVGLNFKTEAAAQYVIDNFKEDLDKL